MFCVECGREGKLYESLCENCFRKKTVLAKIPSDVDAVTCSYCNSLFLNKKWFKSRDVIMDAVSSSVKYHKDAEECDIDVKSQERCAPPDHVIEHIAERFVGYVWRIKNNREPSKGISVWFAE